MVMAAIVAGCHPPARKAPAGKPPVDSLAAILEEPDTRTLSASLNRFIEARKSDPAGLDRQLRAAGFRHSDGKPGCVRHVYTGKPRKEYLVIDDTLHILVEECGSNPRTQRISIRRGSS
jgi:hypothetical protein